MRRRLLCRARARQDYFGYNVHAVMNITDVDDKIIVRARRKHLLQLYRQERPQLQEVFDKATEAVNANIARQQEVCQRVGDEISTVQAERDRLQQQGDEAGAQQKERELRELDKAHGQENQKLQNEQDTANRMKQAALDTQSQGYDAALAQYLAHAAEPLAGRLDQERKHTVNDWEIFRAHGAHYEEEFMQDMDQLGCLQPQVLTRVSEHMPEIISYVDKIVRNGLAYESNGSVYFDTCTFRQRGCVYGKLKPWAVESACLAADGEADFVTSEKRHKQDFALWKASKPGEPSWSSPWGSGRPGWHIECSAMAHYVLGDKLDIHVGGEDLRFPHHDNELAQAEAHHQEEWELCSTASSNGEASHDPCRAVAAAAAGNMNGSAQWQWVNYFLHTGHLSISGLKMSKSLKNFISIRDALKNHSPRQLRLMFALHHWHKPMVFDANALRGALETEATLRNFFRTTNALLRPRKLDGIASIARWQEEESKLRDQLAKAQDKVDACLRDNLDTPGAIFHIEALIRAANLYRTARETGVRTGGPPPQRMLLREVTIYVTRILRAMGLSDAPPHGMGFGNERTVSKRAADCLDACTGFRDQVRLMARQKAPREEICGSLDRLIKEIQNNYGVRLEPVTPRLKDWTFSSLASKPGLSDLDEKSCLDAMLEFKDRVRKVCGDHKAILQECDRLRDEVLPLLGVLLQDRADDTSEWVLEDPTVLAAEAEQKRREEAAARLEKRRAQLDKKRREIKKWEDLSRPIPTQLASKFSKFDKTGNPTHTAEGTALEPKAASKAAKEADKLRKARGPLDKKLAEDPAFLDKLRKEMSDLETEVTQAEQ
ncbi:hypothetical protein WJX73_002469 [Symbiochloris irregularis]|uniref:tRNA synthetases class I catalytic domain-containing protein n=1 Tax=Symbiochloris irregularis TaxID=706552 RepID=A0AAW1NY47_9CHLO